MIEAETSVTNDGTNVTMKLAASKSGLSTAGVCFTSSTYDGDGLPGGQVGFRTAGSANQEISIGDFELSADRDSNGSYETLEHVDDFVIDSGGQAEDTLTYDAAGNLTYDGVFAYTYDAWNRLTKIHKAFRNPASPSTVTAGSLITQNTYDGAGQRITKVISNSGYLDATYEYYYSSSWQLLETRNGSGQVIKQHVWGAGYIDELVQIAVNGNPTDDANFDPDDPDHDFRGYWAMQDSNYNVLGIVDDTGKLVERYEYTPYGKRTVFYAPGSNDELAMASTELSRRVTVSGVLQPYGINEFGHQGLMHDEATGLVYNRIRMLDVRLGKFINRDPLGYVDGMSLYGYLACNPLIFADPAGLWLGEIAWAFTKGAAQGVLNAVNGVQDAAVGTANLYIAVQNGTANLLGAYDQTTEYIHSPDWSKNLITYEDHHELSKFAGGQGLIGAATGFGGMAAEGTSLAVKTLPLAALTPAGEFVLVDAPVVVITGQQIAVGSGLVGSVGGIKQFLMEAQGGGGGGDDCPTRVTNPKHHPNSASPEPRNVQDLYNNSIVDKNGVRWAKDSDGTIHRFSAPRNGESHWNGSTGGNNPIAERDIPIEIRKALK